MRPDVASKPTAIGASAKIGHLTWSMYKRVRAATLNCLVRMRIWTITLITGEQLSWDLDTLTLDERKQLVWASIHGKTIVGHNVGFDLTWAVDLCGAELQPECVLDTLLLVRCLIPLVLAKGQPGKEILYPVATVILGGLLTSTLLDMAVTPAVFWRFGRPAADKVLAERVQKK